MILSRLLPAPGPERRHAQRFLVVLGLIGVAALATVIATYGSWSDATAKALSTGKKPRLDHLVQFWVWRGLLIDAVLALGLALTVRWWVGRAACKVTGPPRAGRRFWIIAGAILLLAAGLRVPRLDLSFYNDETHNFIRMTSGEHRHDSPANDEFKWDPVRWSETLWFNGAGNNSQPYSVLSRLSFQSWKTLAGGVDGQVCEWAARLPALVAGLTSLLVLGLAMREAYGDAAAYVTMLAGSVHAWHVRYSTEARGYSLMLLGGALMLLFGQRALKYGRWRDWLGYGSANLLSFWAFPGSSYFLLILNVLLVLHLLWGKRGGRHGWEPLVRLGAAGLMAMLIILPIMLPLIPQLLGAINTSGGLRGTMTRDWWTDMASHLFFGSRWEDLDPANPQSIAITRMFDEHPLWLLAVLAGITITQVGLGKMLSQRGLPRLMVVACVLAVALAWGDMARKGLYLNFWYVTFALPLLICAIGLGVVHLMQLCSLRNHFRFVAGLALAAMALAATAKVTLAVMHRSKGNERDAVVRVRGSIYPHFMADPTARQPLLGVLWSNATLYDPLAVAIHSTADFETLKQRSATEHRPLYVVMGHRQSALTAQPETVKQLDGSGFEPVATYPGLDESYYAQTLYRMR